MQGNKCTFEAYLRYPRRCCLLDVRGMFSKYVLRTDAERIVINTVIPAVTGHTIFQESSFRFGWSRPRGGGITV